MNDMQAEHGDHDDLDEGTDNDHHSDGDNGNGGGDGDNGGDGTNNDGNGGDGNGANNDRNSDGGDGTNNDGYGGGERVREGANNDGSEGGGDGDGDGGDGDGERTNNDHNGGGGEGPIGYADAMSELEHILRDLEGNDLDVDMLASRVERASLLIGLCRTRIGAARVQVERVVANLDSDDDKYGIEAGSEAGN